MNECVTADGGSFRTTWRGSVAIVGTVMVKAVKLRLKDVYYAEYLIQSIISCGMLEAKAYGIVHRRSTA